MRLHYYITLICSVVLFVGCSSDEATMSRLYEAERIAEENPQRALEIMHTIDVDNIRGDEDMARYRLVYSEVAYYNRKDVDNDSLTAPLYDYYLYNHDNHALRTRAMYQHALVKFNQGENAESFHSLLEVELSLAHVDNPRLAAIVHMLKGAIYGDECLFQNALDEYIAAKDIIDNNAWEHFDVYVIYNIGGIYKHLKEYDSAEKYLKEAIGRAISSDYIALLGYCLWDLAEVYILTDRFDQCDSIVKLYDKYGCVEFHKQHYYYLRAIVEAYAQNRDSALEYLTIAESYPRDKYIEDLYFTQVVYELLGDYQTALYYSVQSKEEQDALMLEALDVPVINVQLDYVNSRLESEQRQSENSRLRYTIIIVSILFTSLLVVVYLRYRNMRQRRDIAEYMTIVAELQQSIAMSETISKPTYSHYEDFAELNKLCEIYYTYGNTSNESRKVALGVKTCIESLRNDQSRIQNLENIVNLRYNDIMVQLRDRCPKLNAKELKYALYILLGFSSRSMCVLLDLDAASLSRLKYKIKNKLIASKCEDLMEMMVGRDLKGVDN